MLKFTDISDEKYKPTDFRLSPKEFFEKRRISKKPYVFDLRGTEDYEVSHLSGSLSLPVDEFENSIYQMPFTGDILLYGSENGEVLTAAEILYDNGFDTFFFVDSYESLFASIDWSYVKASERAEKRILEQLAQEKSGTWGLKMKVEEKSARKAQYSLEFISNGQIREDDFVLESGKFKLAISREALAFIEGTELILNEENELEARNPQFSITKISGSVDEQIQQVLEAQVNPMVAAHGGVVRLLEVKENSAYLEFGGGCQGCGMIDVTLKQGVEVMIKEQIPEIEAIYDVTDHAEGSNPYYNPSTK